METDKKGYVYFVYSNVVNMIYVGQTISKNRIEIYKLITNEKDTRNKLSSYNYYTKNNTINYELAGDLFNSNNEFEIFYLQSDEHKDLERSYIKYLSDNGYKLYNKQLYKKHKYDVLDIDYNIISLFSII
jgi:hypothetical protein